MYKVQSRTHSIFGDAVYSCYCKFRLVIPPPLPPFPWWGLRGRKFLILTILDCWKRHFREQNYIENYFYLLKRTTSTETTSQKYWRNIIWADFFGCPYRSNSIKTGLGSAVKTFGFQRFYPHFLYKLFWILEKFHLKFTDYTKDYLMEFSRKKWFKHHWTLGWAQGLSIRTWWTEWIKTFVRGSLLVNGLTLALAHLRK